MKMKKVLAMVVCCVMAVTMFSSCGTAGENSQKPSTQTPSTQNPGGQQNPSMPVVKTVTAEQWDAIWKGLPDVNNVTLDLQATNSYREQASFALLTENRLYQKNEYNGMIDEGYITLEDGVYYEYAKNEDGEWERRISDAEMQFRVGNTSMCEAFRPLYDQMQYDETNGVYYAQNVLIEDEVFAFISVEFTNGKISKLMYRRTEDELEVWKFSNYGTTKVVLPSETPEDDNNNDNNDDNNDGNHEEEIGQWTYELCSDGTINFGEYPQTKVTSASLIKELTSYSSLQDWISYDYYINGSASDYMWYKAVEYNGSKYRGICIDEYRPSWTTSSSDGEDSDQYKNGYYTDTYYWFKYEKINWSILSTDNDVALLVCNSAIDSQEYYHSRETRGYPTADGQGIYVYASNYAESNIRRWLNETFYETAFTAVQQNLVLVSCVDNSESSTNPYWDSTYFNGGENPYVCENTYDNVFLLSEAELTNNNYGFSIDPYEYDIARRRQASDYAQAQGCFVYRYGDDSDGCVTWWTRSPSCVEDSYSAFMVGGDGYVKFGDWVFNTTRGVVPAVRILLEN